MIGPRLGFHQELFLKVLVDTRKLLGFSSFVILAFAIRAFAKLAASMAIFATFAASLVNLRPTLRISGSSFGSSLSAA